MTPRELVLGHLHLVEAIATRLRASVLTGADREDLIGYGAIGLCKAAARFDATRGVAFSTFAFHLIRGEILEGARREMGGRKHLGFETVGSGCGLDGAVDPGPLPDTLVAGAELAAAVRAAVAALPERERRLVEAVDLRGERLDETGAAMGLSKASGCRACKAALGELRLALEHLS